MLHISQAYRNFDSLLATEEDTSFQFVVIYLNVYFRFNFDRL